MPTYLLHGFRWNRASIRIHIILQDLEDAAAEWLVAPATSITLLNSFYTLYDFLPPSNPPPPSYHLPVAHEQVVVQDAKKETPPRLLSRSLKNLRRISSATLLKSNGLKNTEEGEQKQRPKTSAAAASTSTSLATETGGKKVDFNDWSVVKLVEQYNPDDLQAVSQPYAYVADHMVKIELSASLTEEIAKYEAKKKEDEALLSPSNSSPTTLESTSKGAIGEVASPTISPLAQERREKRSKWFEKLRDGLEKDSEIGWYVVVCGDEERALGSIASTSEVSFQSQVTDPQKTPTRSGFRGFFSRRKASREERV